MIRQYNGTFKIVIFLPPSFYTAQFVYFLTRYPFKFEDFMISNQFKDYYVGNIEVNLSHDKYIIKFNYKMLYYFFLFRIGNKGWEGWDGWSKYVVTGNNNERIRMLEQLSTRIDGVLYLYDSADKNFLNELNFTNIGHIRF